MTARDKGSAADGQKWFVEGFYHLNAGKNLIRLEQPQFFPHIDKILFIPRFGSRWRAGRVRSAWRLRTQAGVCPAVVGLSEEDKG